MSVGPIQSFEIKGLHGYKDIKIEFAGSATIVVAENGTGKTTILNALNAFLSRRFHRLATLNFESIECQFSGSLFPLILKKIQINSGENGSSELMGSLTSQAPELESRIRDFIQNTYVSGSYEKLRTHPLVRNLYVSTSHTHETLEQAFEALLIGLDGSLTDEAKAVSNEVRLQLGDCEIVYLPTYRRIERPLLRKSRSKPQYRRDFDNLRGAGHDDMAFGLSDVEERLADLSEDIERRSNLEYRALSARMLDEMLKGRGTRQQIPMQDLPDIDSLARFLSRVGHKGKATLDDDLFSRISYLYQSGRIEDEENWFLRYFLSRLSQVINQTRETEFLVERFVSVCNGYLTLSSDEKSLAFDPQTLRVVVQGEWANRPISLDDLSSGEKQIISLMARLYLNRNRKIVLIDEPELSLSLDWQKKVLVDVLNSPTVEQFLAITHSPFVFDNELDSYARPLSIRRSGEKNGAS